MAEEEGLPAPRHVPILACCGSGTRDDPMKMATANGMCSETKDNLDELRQVTILLYPLLYIPYPNNNPYSDPNITLSLIS